MHVRPPRSISFLCHVAWLTSLTTACSDEDTLADRYAGVVGATILADGAIVVLPPSERDAGAPPESPAQDDGGPAPLEGGAPVGSGSGGACDLTGRWLVSERVVVVGLGVRQGAINWRYYEIAQSGDAIQVKRGLNCGGKVVPIDPLGEAGDFSPTWPHLQRDVRADGRTGSARAAGSGCAVKFDRQWEITSASPHYAENPSAPLPTLEQKATDSSPGWFDADNDGKPGFGSKMMGLVSGTTHIVQRRRNDWSGNIAGSASTFRLHSDWNNEVKTLAIEGSELLATESARDPEESGHFVAFVKLSDTQAAGADESAICAEVRKLSPMLSPEANR